MPELLLHIGTHKTGTTSIQHFCQTNRAALRKQGLWYPPADLGDFDNHYAHHHVAHAIAGRSKQRNAETARRFFDRVARKLKRGERALISAEPFYRHLLVTPEEHEATPGELHAEREERMRAFAERVRDVTSTFDVTVMVMLRRQDVFVESLYAEHIMATGYRRPIERFLIERDFMLDYERRLDAWAQAFGDAAISIQTFDSSKTGPIERRFIEWAGATWTDDLVIGERQNVSLPRALVEYKRLVNQPGQSAATSQRLRRWLERLASQPIAADLPQLAKVHLAPAERTALLARYRDGNAAIVDRFGGTDAPLFDDPEPTAPTATGAESLDQRAYEAITQHLLLMLADSGVD